VGASAASITVLPERPAKPANPGPAQQKTTDVTGASATGSQPDASQSNSPVAQPQPTTSSTPPPDKPQPPADDNKPQ
jgi:hypothetical protein